MTKPDFHLCDMCGEKTKHQLFIATDRRLDPAGSMDDVGETVDLCGKCAIGVLGHVLADKDTPYTVAERAVAFIRKK